MDMNWTCKKLEAVLPDLAEGKEIAGANLHLKSCPDCAKKLNQFKVILSSASVPVAHAPSQLISLAKSIGAGTTRVGKARLFGSSLTLAQARSNTSNFQLVVGNDQNQIRLMYSRLPGGKWEVTGRAPSSDWKLKRGSRTQKLDPLGGFVFRAPNLDETQFTLSKAAEEMLVPSAQELLDAESN